MNKFIKCWVFIICLLFILLILFTDNVNAESLTQLYIGTSNLSNNVRTINANTGVTTTNVEFTQKFEYTQNFEYVKGQILPISVINQQYYSLDGINYYYTCSQTQWTSSTGASYTITYADGTQATISGTDMETYCSRYNANISSQSTISTTINDNHPYIQLKVIQKKDNNIDNHYRLCDIDNNGQFKCSLNPAYKNIYGFQIMIGNSGYNNSYQVTITRDMYAIISDTQQIINNNNQNTQTIHNDNQQQYNFISSTTIDSNTTSNVNNIDTSNSDTKLAVTNFALIPLNFMQSIINSFSSSCSQVCIGNCQSGHINDWRFVFPCLDLESIVGSTVYAVIDSLFAFGMVFAFIRSVRKFFINALLLTTDASSEVGVFL